MNSQPQKGKYDRSKTAETLGYENYKDVMFQYISGIHIDRFRSLVDRDIKLGRHLTLITGKNGTMKSSILGLIAHPFSSPNEAKDMYGKDLKTKHSDVFKLSLDKDDESYIYYLQALTTTNQELSEPIRLYRSGDRHRVTVGPDNKASQGNFLLNTSYLNLKRLFPIIETDAKRTDIEISIEDQTKISKAYQKIMQRSAYKSSEAISDLKSKNTLAPLNSYYDFNSISSGEDNLGLILCKMLAFEKNKTNDTSPLQGLLCIDEIEASLHPSSQVALIRYLFEWANQHNIQVICTTHSLYIINYCIQLQADIPTGESDIVINNISTQQIGNDNNYSIMVNPDYKTIYKELTFQDVSEPSPYKVNIICEDELGISVMKKILKPSINKNIEYISDLGDTSSAGISYNSLISLAKNGKKLLDDSIIIVDPDVPNNKIESVNFPFLAKIPSSDELLLPIEQRIVQYLFSLDGSNPIFSSIEKSAFIQTCTDCEIYQENYDNPNTKVIKFKNWRAYNKKLFNKALAQYLKDNSDTFTKFRLDIIELINARRAAKALPPLE